jgi:hypothetical protein
MNFAGTTTYVMTPEDIVKKIKSFSHAEINTKEIANSENIQTAIQQGRDFFNHGYKFKKVDIASDFPHSVTTLIEFQKWLI